MLPFILGSILEKIYILGLFYLANKSTSSPFTHSLISIFLQGPKQLTL